MSHLTFHSYDGKGVENANSFGYSESVRVENTVYISGQGGWTRTLPTKFAPTQLEQIDQAFENIEAALKEEGATFENVFKVVSYHRPLDKTILGRVGENFKKWMPNHKPLWTCVEVTRLGEDEMLVEVEVVAHIPVVAK
ncbi:NRAMP-like transporter smf-3 [Stygiomarasmius scandens]|uniref:NRAMP-like transporter smf-3 n=1 Tax=Marasmiellus scandens TaxID=2682957 RepID=A0ABR1IVF2_9AGAR